MIPLPPIPNDAINEATAEVFAITNSLTLAARVGHDALNAALPYIVIATLRHFADWNPDGGLDLLADEIEGELNK